MRILRLVNVKLFLNDDSDYFEADNYRIYPKKSHITTIKEFKKHTQNAIATFSGEQEDSIIFSGGIVGDIRYKRKRKFIDDIIVLGSLMNGRNWGLYSRKNYSAFPALPQNYLEDIQLNGKADIEKYFKIAISSIKKSSWQEQYENGFHLIMLLNRANIINSESRFLSNIVIWEWLYPHLKNPNGATIDDECDDLSVVLDFILNYFWPNKKFNGNNIFKALRNQLAHSGKIPINRKRSYVDSWMTALTWEAKNGNRGINDYIIFFDKLTQIIVLKTLGINAEKIIKSDLDSFLDNGKI